MIHIVTSGCSFSAWDGIYKCPYGNMAWPYRIPQVENHKFKLHNVSISGSGNFIVALNCINKVNNLINSGIDVKNIKVFIQWTGLFRPTVYNDKYHFRNVPFCDIAADSELKSLYSKSPNGFIEPANYRREEFWATYYDNYYSTPAALIDTLDSILKVQWYLKSNNIDYSMFTGWDIFTTPDGKEGWLIDDKMLRPNQFTGGEYTNKDYNLLADLHPWASIFWKMIDFNKFWFFENENIKYGGMIQWIQQSLDMNYWYQDFPKDPHPSKYAHAAFAQKVIFPLLENFLKGDI